MDALRDIRQTDPGAFIREHRQEVLAALERVLDSGWYILGSEVAGFEREFAEQFGYTHAIGVANGTDALSLALRALDIGAGDTVATVSHTAVATAAAIDMTGATPLFIDIDAQTYTLDPEALRAALESSAQVRAIAVVHLYGQPADMPKIMAVASRFGIPVVEDCAQAHGASIDGRFVGCWGEAASFSFYPTKNLGAIGDGGMVVSAGEEIAARVRMLREYGWKERYISLCAGINSRLDELQAAYLRLRLPLLEAGNRRRAAIAAAYDRGLARTGLVLPAQRTGMTHVYHQYVVRHPNRDELRMRLKKLGVGTNIHYPVPVHRQPGYGDRCGVGPGGLQATERVAREVLSLPVYPELDDASVEEIIDAVRKSV
jgi:dTDP-4-amino-4,6-dideoxygalactose transaminase